MPRAAMKLLLVSSAALSAPALVAALTASAVAATLRGAEQRLAALLPGLPGTSAGSFAEVAALPDAATQVADIKDQILHPGVDEVTFWSSFSQALVIVFSAEMFDKTWFVTLLYSLNSGTNVAFLGSYGALVVHTIISAGIGMAFAKVLSRWLLHMITALIFGVFACFYAYECYTASPDEDAMKNRKQEAKESMEPDEIVEQASAEGREVKPFRSARSALTQVFVAVFIAEWGDRTQVAMVSLHASLPILPVVLGSLLAFFLSCISAVALAAALSKQSLSERTISGVSAVSFFFFALVALVSGVKELQATGPNATPLVAL